MDDLIERLSKATGPDRELGNAVLLACGWRQEECPGGGYIWTASPDSEPFADGDHPDPTRSIDAAMALMSPEWHRSLSGPHYDYEREARYKYCAIVREHQPPSRGRFRPDAEGVGWHSIPAIALCIAVRKARASLTSPLSPPAGGKS